MFCFKCGAQISEGTKFCAACGAEITAPEFGAAEPVSQAASAAAEGEIVSPAVDEAAPMPADIPAEAAAAPESALGDNPAPMPPEGGSIQFINNTAPNGQDLFTNAPQQNYDTPVENVAAAEPTVYTNPAGKPQRKKGKKLNLPAAVVLAVVFGLFSLAFGLYAFTGGIVRTGVESGKLSDDVSDIELGEVVVGDILTQESMSGFAANRGIVLPERRPERATVAEIAALSVNKSAGITTVTEEQMNEIIKRTDVSGELAKLVKAYEEYIISGSTEELPDGICDEIKEFVEKNEHYFISIAKIKLSSDYEEQLVNALDGNQNSIEQIHPDTALHDVSYPIRFALSPILLVVLLVLSIGLAVLPGIVSKRANAAFITGGVVYSLIGIVLIVASVLVSNLTLVGALDYSVVSKVLSPLLYSAFGANMLYAGLITLGAGVLCIAVFVVINIVGKKRSAA